MFKKIILNSGVQIIGRGISLVISITIASILTRQLGVNSYGNYVFISSFVTLLIAVANWGTQIIGVRELSRTKDKGQVLGSLNILRLLFSLITILLGGMLVIFLPTFDEIRLESAIVLPLVLVVIFESTSYIVFQTFVRMELKSFFQTLSQFLLLGLTVFLLKRNWQIMAPLTAYLLAKLITGLIAFPISINMIKSKIKLNKEKIKKLLWATLPLGTQLVLFTSYDQAIDSFVIKNYLGTNEVGIYGLAYKIYSNLVLPAYYLNSTIFPLLSKNNKKSLKSFKTAVGLTIIGLIFLVPLTVSLSSPVINFISGSAFLPSSQILKVLSFSLIFAYFNHLTGFLLIAKNRQIDSLKIGLVALVWNLSLNLILIPKFGIIAAAWITVSTEALVTLLSAWKLIRCYNKRI